MVRTAITIITLFLSVVMSSLISAQNIEVTGTQRKDDNFIIYVKDIPLPDSVKIYGQPTFKQDKKYYGGDATSRFINKYSSANRSCAELTFDRDTNGIFFKIPASADRDSVSIALVQAYDAGGQNGWCPQNNPGDNISVVWWLKKKPKAPDSSNHTYAQVDTIQATDGKAEMMTATSSSWHLRNIDWVLFVLIVFLALAAFFGKNKTKENHADKATLTEDLKFEIADLKKQIEALKEQIAGIATANNNCTKIINDVVRRYNTLESEMHKLQKKERQNDTDNKNEIIQALRQTSSSQPINLGSAEPVAGEKTLAINSSKIGFFQLTRNVDGQVTFTLVDNPEVRNLFETNSSMLEIYKNDGIISFDSISYNSHVYVEKEGIAKEMGSEKYEVVAPLKLIFK